jgi:hypothetical protein
METRHAEIFSGVRTVESLTVACREGCGLPFPGAFCLRGRGLEEMTLKTQLTPMAPASQSSRLATEAPMDTDMDSSCTLVSRWPDRPRRAMRWLCPTTPCHAVWSSEN